MVLSLSVLLTTFEDIIISPPEKSWKEDIDKNIFHPQSDYLIKFKTI